MDLDECLTLLALLFALSVSIFFHATNTRLERQLEAARTQEDDALEQVLCVAKLNSKDLEELFLVRKELQTTAGERNNLLVEVQILKEYLAEEQKELGDGHTGARLVTELGEFLAHLPSLTPTQLEEQDHMAYADAVQKFCPCIKPRCFAAFTVLAEKMAELAISNHGLNLMTQHLERIERLLELNNHQSTRIENQQQIIRQWEETDGLINGKMPSLRDAVLQLEEHLRLPKRAPAELSIPGDVWLLFNTELSKLDTINKTLSDPRSNQHLRIKALRWEREANESTRLRTLNTQLSANNTNTADLRATINRLRPQAGNAATLTQSLTSAQSTISNMTVQIHNLKREASGSETAKLRSELATLNSKITEQQQTIATQQTQLSHPSHHNIAHVAVDIKPFGLSSTRSFELEAVRLLKWIQSTNKEVMTRAERMNVRTGLGWDAYAALEALIKQVLEDLEEGVHKVLALEGRGKTKGVE